MYRKDILDAKGLAMPEKPTWDQVADLAAKADGAAPGMKGICLRGQPGWGQVFAPLTTVVNTFGGTWYDKDWNAKVNAPEFTAAAEFYTKLVREHGEAGAAQAGFTECLNSMSQGKVAMWYDATSAAGALEAPDSPVKGKIGYAQAPVKNTKSSGWLWTWSWAMQAASKKQEAAGKFIAWASSKDYEELVAHKLGWAKVPSGKRISTYENAEFQKAERFAIENADPKNPGAQPRPAVGIQFVGIPEFAALGTSVSQGISSAIAGQGTVADALAKGQQAAEKVGNKYK
jgi:sorbitol/mannitol transport system substrate-binding protein